MPSMGTCPICNGSGRVPAESILHESLWKIKKNIAGWDAETDTMCCKNCGGQTMSVHGIGQVPLRKDNNEPCVHKYLGQQAGRCYWKYTCEYCGDNYSIDSGD